MAIITLTTDFGVKDFFVGAVKGAIYTENSGLKIVDISHHIEPFNIQQCVYVLENAYPNFPKGTIHIVGVDSEVNPENQHIVALLDGHYFITSNNGFIRLIAKGKKIEKLIERVSDNGDKIIGNVIYIDNYGNVVTNIPQHVFNSYRKGRKFELHARNNVIKKIRNKYSDIINFDLDKNNRKGAGDLIALFNSSGYIELAIYKSNLETVGGASTLLGLEYRDTITINFL